VGREKENGERWENEFAHLVQGSREAGEIRKTESGHENLCTGKGLGLISMEGLLGPINSTC